MIKKKVVIGMSGGVDSSVSAWLLKMQGFDVMGLFMKNWEDDDIEHCTSRQDFVDAVSVADVIGIDIETVNFSLEYKNRVFIKFLYEYKAGYTPNPDIICNAEIKFKVFLDYAMQLGADFIATGHYVRVRKNSVGKYELLKAIDTNKDQSYFLYRLTQSQLSKSLFPIGEIYKTEVRKIAKSLKLPNATKKDSTGICFIGKRPFRKFLERYLSYEPGLIKTSTSNILGEHIGLSFYTLGQRKGIGIGGIKMYKKINNNYPWYVARKDLINNILYVVHDRNHPWLFSLCLNANQINWITDEPSDISMLSAKIRYRQTDVHCKFYRVDTNNFKLHFDNPQWAITPGQSVVLYQGDICLGGGIIIAEKDSDNLKLS